MNTCFINDDCYMLHVCTHDYALVTKMVTECQQKLTSMNFGSPRNVGVSYVEGMVQDLIVQKKKTNLAVINVPFIFAAKYYKDLIRAMLPIYNGTSSSISAKFQA